MDYVEFQWNVYNHVKHVNSDGMQIIFEQIFLLNSNNLFKLTLNKIRLSPTIIIMIIGRFGAVKAEIKDNSLINPCLNLYHHRDKNREIKQSRKLFPRSFNNHRIQKWKGGGRFNLRAFSEKYLQALQKDVSSAISNSCCTV